LFIAGGAFVGLDNIVKGRIQGTSIGFGAEVNRETTNLDQTTPDDLVRFGMIPEFVGRFPAWVALQQLTKEDLIKILIDIKHSYISQYKWLFGQDQIELEFTPDALEQIATNTIVNKTGARGLHSELERVLLPHMYRLAEYRRNNITNVKIDKSMVNTPKELKQVNE
jgi:ATP-dependent Clp protease ATP-binding subunit ClpX